ncbi:hypothetical protein ACLI1A_10080 [Flavobacterium sp. RHBU_3]|uniref:hypothetical protein n=1 Tax=Flavobacterium sp. RHBU_3 TaxID=3391184 RepID=UPI00398517E1
MSISKIKEIENLKVKIDEAINNNVEILLEKKQQAMEDAFEAFTTLFIEEGFTIESKNIRELYTKKARYKNFTISIMTDVDDTSTSFIKQTIAIKSDRFDYDIAVIWEYNDYTEPEKPNSFYEYDDEIDYLRLLLSYHLVENEKFRAAKPAYTLYRSEVNEEILRLPRSNSFYDLLKELIQE